VTRTTGMNGAKVPARRGTTCRDRSSNLGESISGRRVTATTSRYLHGVWAQSNGSRDRCRMDPDVDFDVVELWIAQELGVVPRHGVDGRLRR
jgi:hypothetical protein